MEYTMASPATFTLTEANFETEVSKATVPVVVDFWAEWCGPCKALAPALDEIATEYAGKLKIGKVNVDEEQGLATRFGIRAIPTLIIFKGGVVKEQIMGNSGKKDLLNKIAPYLG
jgi:thioredoxin 1